MRNLNGFLAGAASFAAFLAASGTARAEVGDVIGQFIETDGTLSTALIEVEEYVEDGTRKVIQSADVEVDEDGGFTVVGVDSEAPLLVLSAYDPSTGDLLGRSITAGELDAEEENPTAPLGELSTFQVEVLDEALADPELELVLDEVQPVLLMTLIDEETMNEARNARWGGFGTRILGGGFAGANLAFNRFIGHGFRGVHPGMFRRGLGIGFRGFGRGLLGRGFHGRGVIGIGHGALGLGVGALGCGGAAPIGMWGYGMCGGYWPGLIGGVGTLGVTGLGLANAFQAAAVTYTSVVSYSSTYVATNFLGYGGGIGGLGGLGTFGGLGLAAGRVGGAVATTVASSVSYSSFTSVSYTATNFATGIGGLHGGLWGAGNFGALGGAVGGLWPWLVGGARSSAVSYSATTAVSYSSSYLQSFASGIGALGAWPGIYGAGRGLASTVSSTVSSSFYSSVSYSAASTVGGFGAFGGIGVPAFAAGVGGAYGALYTGLPGVLGPHLGGLGTAHVGVFNDVLGATIGGGLLWNPLGRGLL